MQVEQAGPPNRPERCLQENNRASQGRSRTRKRNRPSLPLEGSFLPRPTGKKPSRAFGRAPICRVTSGFPIEALTRSASKPTGASGAPRPAPRSPRGKPKAAAIGRGGVFRGDGEGKGPPAGNRRSAKSDFPAIRKSRTPGGGWQRPCHRSLFEILRRGRIFGRYQFLFEVPRKSSSCSLLPPPGLGKEPTKSTGPEFCMHPLFQRNGFGSSAQGFPPPGMMKARDRPSRNSSPWTPPPRQKRREGRGDSWKRLSTTRQPDEITRTRGRSGKRAHSAHRLVENEAALIAASILEQAHETFEADLGNLAGHRFPGKAFPCLPRPPPDRSSLLLAADAAQHAAASGGSTAAKACQFLPAVQKMKELLAEAGELAGGANRDLPFTGRDRFLPASRQMSNRNGSILNLLSAFTPNVSPAGKDRRGPEATGSPCAPHPSTLAAERRDQAYGCSSGLPPLAFLHAPKRRKRPSRPSPSFRRTA